MEWYQRKGYKIWKTEEGITRIMVADGKPWVIKFVLMKKNLV
jgi:hypothetical protein